MTPSPRERYIEDLKRDYAAQWQYLLELYNTTTNKDDLEDAEQELERLEDLLIQEGISPDA